MKDSPTNESYVIDVSEPQFVRIDRSATVSMAWGPSSDSYSVWFERASLAWVVAALRECIETYGAPSQRTTAGQDSLRIDETGPEPAPFINIFNRRPLGAPHEGAQLVSLSKPRAAQLLAELEQLR